MNRPKYSDEKYKFPHCEDEEERLLDYSYDLGEYCDYLEEKSEKINTLRKMILDFSHEIHHKSIPKLVEFNDNLELVKKGYLYKCPTCGSYSVGLMKRPYNDEIVQENYCSNCSQYLDWSLVRYIEGLNFKR